MNRGFNQTVQPAVVKQQYDPERVWDFENRWRSDLFDCKPWSQCCLFCCCGCCMGCKLSKRLGESAIIGCCPCALPYFRTKLRTARRIEGGCCGDFCATNCCMPCAGNQLANELDSQGLWDDKKSRKTYPRNDNRSNQNNDDY
ncbi:unnamed protein product [Rotaria magnacalcarata]|uniref:Uncharacterized protein n=1 Tax=Rotaria magnacalcarata TaxID=392030 RepID=A0A816YB80_9BILA|nr:unnamed protein product [Rotaria magnacalcarata]CAF1463340.1 unnamed protein product [Rotaria magnacalcarata]CAF2012076.1 unnamed protein product [Rotaria magnacalcarata]CAF2101675.1 unnamed protein product [Rotaria magnacalcarata]CAF2155387.1 unnamed protein product [Rotaria magnacalcarata]